MKKLFTTFLCLIALVCSSQAFAQSISKSITIYDGTAENKYIPFYFYYLDNASTTSQVIYPATALEDIKGKQITDIKFYNAGYSSSWTSNMSVSLAEVDYSTISEDDYISAKFVEVFNGEMAGDESMDSLKFTFNQPFVYTGENLAIEIKNNIAGSTYMQVPFYGVENNVENAVYGYDKRYKGKYAFLPKVTITFEDIPEYGAKVSTDKIDFSTIFTNNEVSQEIRISNTGKNNLTATITGVNAPFEIESTSFEIASTTTSVVPVKFAPTADGNYTGTITIDLGEAGSYEVALSGNAMSAPTGYTQEFNVLSMTLPEGWTGWNVKETYDSNLEAYLYDSSSSNTENFASIEIDYISGVTITEGANPIKGFDPELGYFQIKTYMVSPLVSGNILFSARGTNTADYITPEVTAYKATFDNDNGYTIDETPININWQSPLTNAEWSYGIFTVEEPTQIAFFMSYGAISMFASDAEGEATGINNITANDTKYILNGDDLAIYSNSNLVSYQIVSTSGAIVAQGKLADKAAQVKLNAPAGIYLVSVTSENGTSVYKLLKK